MPAFDEVTNEDAIELGGDDALPYLRVVPIERLPESRGALEINGKTVACLPAAALRNTAINGNVSGDVIDCRVPAHGYGESNGLAGLGIQRVDGVHVAEARPLAALRIQCVGVAFQRAKDEVLHNSGGVVHSDIFLLVDQINRVRWLTI